MFFKELEQYNGHIIAIGESSLNNLPLNDIYYQEISKEEYDNYIKNNPNIYIKKIIKNNVTFSELYNKYYLWYIWKIINEYNGTYKWITFPNNNILDENINKKIHNNYLNKGNDYLIKNILNNGMYFPFISEQWKINNYIRLGKHRFNALNIFSNNNKIKKQFLIITIPYNVWSEGQNNIKKDKNYGVLLTILFMQSNNTSKEFLENFFSFCDIIGNWVFNYKDIIKPNPILNNKQLFENFINGPEPKLN